MGALYLSRLPIVPTLDALAFPFPAAEREQALAVRAGHSQNDGRHGRSRNHVFLDVVKANSRSSLPARSGPSVNPSPPPTATRWANSCRVIRSQKRAASAALRSGMRLSARHWPCLPAAYGDAVVPEITEAIGRTVIRIDARLSEAR